MADPPDPRGAGHDRAPDLLAALGALGRSMQERFDPQRFLDEFSTKTRRLIPHDRLVIDHLGDDGRTFTVFAEQPVLTQGPSSTSRPRHATGGASHR